MALADNVLTTFGRRLLHCAPMGKEVPLYDVTADTIRHLEEYFSMVSTCAPFVRQSRLIQQIGDTISELQKLQQLQQATTVEVLDRLEWCRAKGAPVNAVSSAYRKYPPPFPLLTEGPTRLYRRPESLEAFAPACANVAPRIETKRHTMPKARVSQGTRPLLLISP